MAFCSDQEIPLVDKEMRHYKSGLEYALQGSFKKAKIEFEKALSTEVYFTSSDTDLEVVDAVLKGKIDDQDAIQIFIGNDYLLKIKMKNHYVTIQNQ